MKSIAPALLGAALTLFSPALFAQNDFRIGLGGGTGLETPAPSKPASGKKAKEASDAEKKATEITCVGETLFDGKASTAIFIKDVRIVDPQFTLTADKLTAYLKKSDKNPVPALPGPATPTPAATPTPTPKPAGAKSEPTSGLERAVAEGHVVITQERTDEKTGEVTTYVGRAAKAEYDAAKGEMTLSGWPQIQQGMNNQVATEEGTIMIMDKDGHLHTKGPSMTLIKTDSKNDLNKKNP
ncbi:MAG: LptA/OstA family protein [Chthoniobacteraceae bacterium]